MLTLYNYLTSYIVMRTQYLKSLPEHWLPSAAVFSALGDATRQKILLLFEPGEELSIKEIAACFTLSRTSIVHHLAMLERAGIVTIRRQGKLALYSLAYAPVMDALERLRDYILDDQRILAATETSQTSGQASGSV